MNQLNAPQTDPLAQLREIHLPDPISFWPPAPGWWVLAAICIFALCFIALKFYQHRQQHRYRQVAQATLVTINQRYDKQDYLQRVNELLKQVALAAYPSHKYPAYNIAGMHGKQWLEFLEQSSKHQGFTDGIGQVLSEGPYLPQQKDIDKNLLNALAQHWIKDHYRTLDVNSEVEASC